LLEDAVIEAAARALRADLVRTETTIASISQAKNTTLKRVADTRK
jgi:hypothetical protein